MVAVAVSAPLNLADYGMVETMTRTYRNHKSAVQAGKNHARFTKAPAYVGMMLDCRFHIADKSPARDWRWSSFLICNPDGTTEYVSGRR